VLNAVMTVKDRPRLTEQSILSFMAHTDVEANLTVVDDGSAPETRDLLRRMALEYQNIAVLRNETSKGIVGGAKNLGVYWSEKYWGRGDWLYLSDNDAYFTPQWADQLLRAAACAGRNGFLLMGGQNHPYHKQIVPDIPTYDPHWPTCIREYLALAGTSWLMWWDIWDRFGPLDANAPGVCQSEDAAFCNRIREAGGKVGAIYPPVVLDTGIHQTDGKPSPGADIKARVEGVLYL